MRTSQISPKLCLPCFIIMQSCYYDYRINKTFVCSRSWSAFWTLVTLSPRTTHAKNSGLFYRNYPQIIEVGRSDHLVFIARVLRSVLLWTRNYRLQNTYVSYVPVALIDASLEKALAQICFQTRPLWLLMPRRPTRRCVVAVIRQTRNLHRASSPSNLTKRTMRGEREEIWWDGWVTKKPSKWYLPVNPIRGLHGFLSGPRSRRVPACNIPPEYSCLFSANWLFLNCRTKCAFFVAMNRLGC